MPAGKKGRTDKQSQGPPVGEEKMSRIDHWGANALQGKHSVKILPISGERVTENRKMQGQDGEN